MEDRPSLTFSAGNVRTVLHMAGAQWRLRRNLQAAWITYHLLEEFDQESVSTTLAISVQVQVHQNDEWGRLCFLPKHRAFSDIAAGNSWK